MTSPPLILLPGLGADARLFAPQRATWPEAVVPDWPEIDPNDHGVEEFAARVRTGLADAGLWTERTVLVGFSFGGQIALTMASQALRNGLPGPTAIVLISAPRTTRALTPSFRAQVRSADWLPAGLVAGLAQRVIAPRLASACGLNAADAAGLRAMADDLDVGSFRDHARIATHWQFAEHDERALTEAGLQLEHVHATEDPIIPGPPPTVPGVTWVPGQGHLLTWTHADVVNAAIERALAASPRAIPR